MLRQLTAHPVVRGVDFDILPSNRRQASDMDSMALCKIMDQILNWSGFVPPPGKGPPLASSSFSESVNDPPRISQPPVILAREDIVNNTIGDMPLLNGSA